MSKGRNPCHSTTRFSDSTSSTLRLRIDVNVCSLVDHTRFIASKTFANFSKMVAKQLRNVKKLY